MSFIVFRPRWNILNWSVRVYDSFEASLWLDIKEQRSWVTRTQSDQCLQNLGHLLRALTCGGETERKTHCLMKFRICEKFIWFRESAQWTGKLSYKQKQQRPHSSVGKKKINSMEERCPASNSSHAANSDHRRTKNYNATIHDFVLSRKACGKHDSPLPISADAEEMLAARQSKIGAESWTKSCCTALMTSKLKIEVRIKMEWQRLPRFRSNRTEESLTSKTSKNLGRHAVNHWYTVASPLICDKRQTCTSESEFFRERKFTHHKSGLQSSNSASLHGLRRQWEKQIARSQWQDRA